MYVVLDNERVVRAFAECIAETGVTELKVDDLARRLGSSRAGLYRQFGSWPQMIMSGTRRRSIGSIRSSRTTAGTGASNSRRGSCAGSSDGAAHRSRRFEPPGRC
jgi:hypothetical protein